MKERKSFENGKETDVVGKEAVLSSSMGNRESVGRGEDDDGSDKKEVQSRTSTCQRSTPTSTLDDGYESCNSTPQGGQQRLIRQQSSPSSTLGFTPNLIPKNLQVQVEEDERGFESLLASSSSSQAEADPDSPREEGGDDRETWASNADFLLSIIGFAVDLANVWRFPYLCYKNGGGAFLIPYILMLVFGAVPLFYMELILGQFSRQGPISVWRICPLFKGVGFCAVLVAFYVSFYYNVIIAWSLYFLASSIKVELPWLHCNNVWNTDLCWESMLPENRNNQTAVPIINNISTVSIVNTHTPASEFFHRAVLEMQWSDGLHAMGYPKWQLVLCLLIVYTMLYISLFKGVKSSGKVVWVTATMPYVVLSILLVRGLMLPGAVKGITYYLKPELSKLREAQVWVDAAVQIFYSVGAGFGVHLSYASYNTFHNNCFRDCIVTTIVNSFTSFFSGFVIFTYLGFMSHKQGVPISTVATEGPGLVFQVYPEAVATLPGSHLWSMLFFFMLIMLGLDSAMGGLECVITGLMDEFSRFFKERPHSREFFTLGVIILSFSVSLINVTPGGIYMFHLFDTYSAGISLLCSALFEAIAVSWFYGLDKFSQDAYAMLGRRPGCYWRICWKIISPSFIIGVVIFGLLYHEPLQYNEYLYPSWAEWVGWSLALSSILMIPLVAIIQIIKTPGTLKEQPCSSKTIESIFPQFVKFKLNRIGRYLYCASKSCIYCIFENRC
ncbi:sodium-dependent noradrenaline transporter-like [Agrilus planipennis]|uniref:Transporter n=1 Tax=Agrilus planipennis TaxID=224129 RepID=A0A7F5R6Q3_AGRPL|nr:sodium-dependent noradrenaline transporter-like [Agrilus planipennis]